MNSGGSFGGGGGGGGFTSNSSGGSFGGGSHHYHPHSNSNSRNTYVNRSTYVVVGNPAPIYPGTRAYSAPPAVLVSQGPRIPAWLTLRPIIDIGIVVVMLYMYAFCFNPLHLQVSYRESRLLAVNTFFVKSIEIKPVGSIPDALQSTVYTYASNPALSHTLLWKEEFSHEFVRVYGFESWSLYLNRGSAVSLSYQLDMDGLFLVVLQGADRFAGWKDDPRGFGDTLVFQDISRGGSAKFNADSSSDYFIALGNVHDRPVEVLNLALTVSGLIYDTSSASARCMLRSGSGCWVPIKLLSGTKVVLASPETHSGNMEAYKADVQYRVRLLSFLLVIGSTWFATFLLAVWAHGKANRDYALSQLDQRSGGGSNAPLFSNPPLPLRTPLGRQPSFFERAIGFGWSSEATPSPLPPPQIPAPLPNTWVPSAAAGGGAVVVPSAPPVEVEEGEEREGGEGKPGVVDACSICMDAKKDAILIECGHRATCYGCAQLLMNQQPALCPICRKAIRQVIKVFDA